MSDEIPKEILQAVPGTLGSLVALRWIAGTPFQRICSVVGGVSASSYGADHLSDWLGANVGLTGFLIGLFGMAIASKCFEAIEGFKPGDMIDRFLKKWGW